MNILFPAIGCLTGVLIAILLHKVVAYLRLSTFIKPVSIVGWLAFAFSLFSVIRMIAASVSSSENPGLAMSNALGIVAVILLVFLGIFGGLSAIHAHRYKLPWIQTFGIVMFGVGLACSIGWFLQANLYNFAGIIRGGNKDVHEILESYRKTHEILGWLHLALGNIFLLLEFTPPFLSRRLPPS